MKNPHDSEIPAVVPLPLPGERMRRQVAATDVFLHNLEPFALKSLRRAIEQGLTPSGLDFTGDDESIVILRFTRPCF